MNPSGETNQCVAGALATWAMMHTGNPRWSHPPPLFGNPIDLFRVARAEGFQLDDHPTPGAMVVYGSSYGVFGHIATARAVRATAMRSSSRTSSPSTPTWSRTGAPSTCGRWRGRIRRWVRAGPIRRDGTALPGDHAGSNRSDRSLQHDGVERPARCTPPIHGVDAVLAAASCAGTASATSAPGALSRVPSLLSVSNGTGLHCIDGGHLDTHVRHDHGFGTPLTLRDPLWPWLNRISGGRAWLIWLYVLAAYAVFELGLGFLLSWYYTRVDVRDITSLFNRPDLLLTVLFYLCVMPVFWALYLPEPGRVGSLVRELIKTGVLADDHGRNGPRQFAAAQVAWCNRFLPLLLLAIAIPTLGAMAELPTIDRIGVDRYLFGHTDHWWHVNLLYFVAWNVMLYANYYVLMCILIQRVCTIVIINRTLARFPTRAQLFHHDHVNGFGPVGRYCLQAAPVLFWFGVLLLLLSLYPSLVQGQVAVGGYDVFSLLWVLILVLPTFLMWPAWNSHVIMRRLKMEALDRAARRIRHALGHSDREPDLDLIEVRCSSTARHLDLAEARVLAAWTELLTERYEILDREHRTWPFRRIRIVLSGYFFTTGLPLAVAAISAYLQYLSVPRR